MHRLLNYTLDTNDFCWIIAAIIKDFWRCGQDGINDSNNQRNKQNPQRCTLLSINHFNLRTEEEIRVAPPKQTEHHHFKQHYCDMWGWWMWRCDVVIADRQRINPGQLWMLHTTGTVKANKPFHTPLLPWKLTTLRASVSFHFPRFSPFNNNVKNKCLNISSNLQFFSSIWCFCYF